MNFLSGVALAAAVALQALDASETHTVSSSYHPCCVTTEANPILHSNPHSFYLNMGLFAAEDVARGAVIRALFKHDTQKEQDIAQAAGNIFQVVQSAKGVQSNIKSFAFIRSHGN